MSPCFTLSLSVCLRWPLTSLQNLTSSISSSLVLRAPCGFPQPRAPSSSLTSPATSPLAGPLSSSLSFSPVLSGYTSVLCCLFVCLHLGLPWWLCGREPACQCGRHGFDPFAGKIPWRRGWQPTPVFLPGESHGQRTLEG